MREEGIEIHHLMPSFAVYSTPSSGTHFIAHLVTLLIRVIFIKKMIIIFIVNGRHIVCDQT